MCLQLCHVVHVRCLGDQLAVDVCSVWHDDAFLKHSVSLMGYGFFGDVMRESEQLRWMGPRRYDIAGFRNFMANRCGYFYSVIINIIIALYIRLSSVFIALKLHLTLNLCCNECLINVVSLCIRSYAGEVTYLPAPASQGNPRQAERCLAG